MGHAAFPAVHKSRQGPGISAVKADIDDHREFTMTIQTIISTNMNRNGRDHIEALRQAGYRVIEAASIEEAFRMAGQDGEAFLLLQGVDDKRFAILADSASALLWMNRPDGCEFVNRAYLDFLGVRDVDVRGFDWAQFVHLDDRKSYVTSYLEAVVERRFFEATFRFRRYDGQYRWMKSVGTPRFGPAGDFLGYVGSTIDVTDVHQDMEMNQPTGIYPGRIRSTFFEKLTAIPPVLLTGGVLAIAMLLRISLTPLFGSGYTFITFYPATMFSTVIAGWRYGLATAAASAMLSILLFLDPFNNVEHAVALGVFLIVDGLMIVIAGCTMVLMLTMGWVRETARAYNGYLIYGVMELSDERRTYEVCNPCP